MVNESKLEFKKRITSYIQKCSPNQYSINLEDLAALLPLTIREIAWIIAICENGYSYSNISWEYPALAGRVVGLESVFREQIDLDIQEYAENEEIALLVPEARADAIQKLMDIQQGIRVDSEGQEVPLYTIHSLINTRFLHSVLIRIISAIKAKQPRRSDNPLQMMPWIKQHNKEIRTKQIMDTVFQICVEQPIRINVEKINMPIQSYNLAWVIVICNKKLNYFEEIRLQELELTSLADHTNTNIINFLQEIGHLHELKPIWFDEVDLRGSDTVKQKLSYEIPANLVLEIITNKAIYKAGFIEEDNRADFENPSPAENDPDTVIDTILKQDFSLLIRETFPNYKGQIQKKTSAPHKLIIKVMIIMLKLKRQDITWSTVKEFIEEHISQNYNRATLINLEDINDDNFTVSGYVLDKINATKKVGDYKRAFKI